MARKPVHRSLPQLRVLFPKFGGFAAYQNQTAIVHEMLRTAIDRIRQPQSVPFYSMRDVAEFFGVSLRVIVRVYEKLTGEGLLTRLRGSQTVLEGRTVQPHHPVRAVVGIPLVLPGFVYGTELRSFYIRLEEELLRYHHLVNFIFIRRTQDIPDPDLAERLLAHKSDIVVWWVPTGPVMSTIMQLRDAGVRIVGITRERESFAFPSYVHNRERSLRNGLETWMSRGIREVELWCDQGNGAVYELNLLTGILKKLGLAFSIHILSDEQVRAAIERVGKKKHAGVIIGYHAWCDALCSQFPIEMERLFQNNRVLLVQGALHHAAFRTRKVTADALTMDFTNMAKVIAADIGTGKVWNQAKPHMFYSRWEPAVNLGTIAWHI